MNLSKPLHSASRLLHILFLQCRSCLLRQRCLTFLEDPDGQQSGIGPIFIINLDRQADRWNDMMREVDCILDVSGKPLSKRVIRHSACDAQVDPAEFLGGADVDPFYTLGDQLFVEPQPHAVPDVFELARPIRMSQAEIAVACSHIDVWKAIAQSSASHTLVLEDDVWFERSFGRVLDEAWREMKDAGGSPRFDLLYVSYVVACTRFG